MYNVVRKTIIYVGASLLAHYLEHLVPVWWRTGVFRPAKRHLWDEMVWAIRLWRVVLSFIYCATRELIRALGPRRVPDDVLRRSRGLALVRNQ